MVLGHSGHINVAWAVTNLCNRIHSVIVHDIHAVDTVKCVLSIATGVKTD